jgi:outer membrane immunogenic protein
MSNLGKGPMRNLLLAGVAVAAIVASSSVMAADLGVQPIYKAAPAPVVLPANWTGFYVGAHLGGAWGTKELSDPFSGKSFLNAGVNGFLGGGQIGYNYQMGWVVLGVEGDLSEADITGSAPFISGSGDTFSSKTDWLATVTGRIGGTVDHALLYVKGGAAWAHDKYSIDFFPGSALGTETRFGWVFGGGVEYAFTHNWSGKVEYNYMDFGTKSVNFCEGTDCEAINVQQRIHAVKVGLNYKLY